MHTLWSVHKCNHVSLTELREKDIHCVSVPAHALIRWWSLFYCIIGSHRSKKLTQEWFNIRGCCNKRKKKKKTFRVCALCAAGIRVLVCMGITVQQDLHPHAWNTPDWLSWTLLSIRFSLSCYRVSFVSCTSILCENWTWLLTESGHCVP